MRLKIKQAAFLISFLALLSGCAVRQGVPVGEVPAISPPSKSEVASTNAAVQGALKEEGKPVTSSGPMKNRAQAIIDRLSRAAGAGNFRFPVYIADAGEEVNAMVADGKTVVIYKALMTRVPEDDQLATILAHELGHVSGKHHQDEGSKDREAEVSTGSSILGSVADVALSAAGYSGLGSTVGDLTETAVHTIGMGAYVLAYDREMEYEADHIGLMIMAKAGYNPEAALRFWKRADEVFGDSNSFSFMSTHPSNSDRLEKMEEYMPIALKYYQPRGGKNKK